MKKQGFTLAEILITLGIVGVIAALTLPTVTLSTQNAKIGPSLATAANSFTSATKALLKDAESDYLSSAYVCANGSLTCDSKAKMVATDGTEFFNNVGRYLSGHRVAKGTDDNSVNSDAFVLDNGMSFLFGAVPAILNTNNTGSDGAAQHDIYMKDFVIDINGAKGPNLPAKDRFWFYIMEDGSLVPYGVDNSSGVYNTTTVATANAWTAKCPNGAKPTDAKYCAASIFDNKLKVEYNN